MKITFIETLASLATVHEAGSTAEVPDAEAERLIIAGIAKPATTTREKATKAVESRATKE